MAQENYLLIGTYTGTGSQGIYVYQFDQGTGKATLVSHTDGVQNPSYLAVSNNGQYVYAVNETHGDTPPMVSAFAFGKQKGQLSFINQQPSGGDDPCYVAISPGGDYVTVGNYSGGSIGVFEILKNGALQQKQVVQHKGSSINKKRQQQAHVHATVFAPDGKYVLAPDLGMDKIMAYRFQAGDQQILAAAEQPFTKTIPGSGPRHLVFHPALPKAYLIEEMAGFVAVYDYKDGVLEPAGRVPTHDTAFDGNIGSADIHVSEDGRFLYASNRGDQNSISIFRLDENGHPVLVAEQPVLGKTPRNFMITPGGNFLLAANQNSDEVVIFQRNKTTGLLTDTGNRIKVPRPVCLKMVSE